MQVWRGGTAVYDASASSSRKDKARARLVAELQQMHSRGVTLTKKSMGASMYGRCGRIFGSLKGALQAADIEYEEELHASFTARADAAREHSPADIAAELRARFDQGRAVHYAAVRADDTAFAQRCSRAFGSHDVALRAAGLDPDQIRPQEHWDKDRVVSDIRERIAEKDDLNSCAFLRKNPKAFNAACRWFGGWDLALTKCGVDPKLVRRNKDTEADRGNLFELHCRKLFAILRPEWSLRNRVLIEGRHYEPDIILPSDAGTRSWGDFKTYSWGMSTKKSMVKYSKLVSELKFIHLLGQDRPPEGNARFESIWTYQEEAERAGQGSILEDIRALETMDARTLASSALALIWTREHCIATIQRSREGTRNVSWQVKHGRGLASAVRRRWGAWDNFLIAAGLDPAVERKQGPRVSRDDTVRWLRDRHAAGLEMSSDSVLKGSRGNTYSAMLSRYFGGLQKACLELGIPYTPRRKPSRPLA